MACYKTKISELKDRMKEVKSSYFQKELEAEKYQAKLKKVVKRLKEMQTEEIDKKTYKKLLKKCDLVEEKLKKKYGKTNKREEKKQEKDEKKKADVITDPKKKDKSYLQIYDQAKTGYQVENPEELTERGQRRGNVTILLFYAYVKPVWTKFEQDAVINHTYEVLQRNNCTGRLRVAREGLNSVLTGTAEEIRAFTDDLKKYQPHNFENTDFKYVDRQPDNHKLRELKVWPVTELVTYGFQKGSDAPISMG